MKTTDSIAPIFVDRRAVCAITTLSKNTIYAMAGKGEFPLPCEISPGRSAWRLSEVTAWADAKKVRTEPAHPEALSALRKRRDALKKAGSKNKRTK